MTQQQISVRSLMSGLKNGAAVGVLHWEPVFARCSRKTDAVDRLALTPIQLRHLRTKCPELRHGYLCVRLLEPHFECGTLAATLAKLCKLVPGVALDVAVGSPKPLVLGAHPHDDVALAVDVAACLEMLQELATGPTPDALRVVRFTDLPFVHTRTTSPEWRRGMDLCYAWMAASKVHTIRLSTSCRPASVTAPRAERHLSVRDRDDIITVVVHGKPARPEPDEFTTTSFIIKKRTTAAAPA